LLIIIFMSSEQLKSRVSILWAIILYQGWSFWKLMYEILFVQISSFLMRKLTMNVNVVVITILFLYSDLVTETTTEPWIFFIKKTLLRVFFKIRKEKKKETSLINWIKTNVFSCYSSHLFIWATSNLIQIMKFQDFITSHC